MTIPFGVLAFLFGIAVGSFLNVVIVRYGTNRSLRGRSFCPLCRAQLSWRELVPLLSFVVQRGRCRSCGTCISWQYPLVELLTGFLFLGVHLKFFQGVFDFSYLLSTIYYLLSISLLIVITVIDYHHKIIPNGFVYTLVVLGAIRLFFDIGSLTLGTPALWHLLAAPTLFAPFALLWFVSGGTWMGFGDAKLAWAIGWLVGMEAGVSAVVFAFWIGALYFLVVLAVQNSVPFILRMFTIKQESKTIALSRNRLRMKSEVPFGPFLVIGTLLVFFTNVDVLSFVTFLFL